MAAVLPALLPTPPRSEMLPLLPTPCLIILPANFVPPSLRPGRADAVDRWDAIKKMPSSMPVPLSSGSSGRADAADRRDAIKKPSSPESSWSGSSGRSGRADAVDRWDAIKKQPRPVSSSSSGSGGSPGRADSVDRWDTNKKFCCPVSSSSSGGSRSPCRASACDRWDNNKTKSPGGTSATSSKQERGSSKTSGRASSAERWDIHKKPRPLQADECDCDLAIENDDAQTKTDYPTEASKVMIKEMVSPLAVFSGGSFFLPSPESCMLPMPSFLRAH